MGGKRGEMPYTVPPKAIADYQRDGVILLRQILSPQQVKELQSGIDYNMAHPSPLARIASSDSDTGRFFEDFCNWRRIPEYAHIAQNPDLSHIAAVLMGSVVSRLYYDHTLVKEPKTQQQTPWHQDQPYYNIDGKQTVSFWIPVDEVQADSAMEFVSGTHNGPWFMPRTFKENKAKWFPEGSLAELPDIEKLRGEQRILSWEVRPGDAVCFNMLTLHSAKGSRGMRRAFSVRYVGDDVVYAPRRWVTSPPFYGLEKELSAGAPLDHPMFPVVFRRSHV
ncbi:phytanoyl-CoA dioxygenase [Trypanosoma grayi]|uniref:phytanoyl-CoA dioxygenase n=1 Tax=Trypanosoma grayi TaxID=71804 RepID=UPI0004F47ABC|nr:phytanoyl-CoA dioxygenase [Trypanosoma grayi]KEG15611.1 phytanoyl-CoA dioxygenase [Trypanosoma grayi]